MHNLKIVLLKYSTIQYSTVHYSNVTDLFYFEKSTEKVCTFALFWEKRPLCVSSLFYSHDTAYMVLLLLLRYCLAIP